jgi:hypothetical protein
MLMLVDVLRQTMVRVRCCMRFSLALQKSGLREIDVQYFVCAICCDPCYLMPLPTGAGDSGLGNDKKA